jgi:beta-galactosidase
MISQQLATGWAHYRGSLGGVWEVWRQDKLKNHFNVPWHEVVLPHCFNAFDTVNPDVTYYQGQGWYRTLLDVDNPFQEGRTLLRFEGAGQKSTVYVYTEETGFHNGGYDEFIVDITEAAERAKTLERYRGRVPVAVCCDNSRDLQTIPSDVSDFNLYGGLYRKVHLVYVPKVSLERIHVESVCEESGKAVVRVKGRLYNPQGVADSVAIRIAIEDPAGKEVGCVKLDASPWEGMRELASLELPQPLLWSPNQPSLYRCVVQLSGNQGATEQTERFGIRSCEFVAKGPFRLNGERLLLRGTHRHDDHAGTGAAMTDEMIRFEMKQIKEMGANFIRLGHYQQSQLVLDLCDELGLLVWEEIPWCRGGLGNEGYKNQCRDMLASLIDQHMNHPSVIVWGMGNENDWEADFDYFDKQAIRGFMKELHDRSHRLDPSRLTGIRRCEFCKDIVDVYSPSIWAGWYRGIYPEYEKYSREGFEGTERFLHLEWGGDNLAGRHAEEPYTGFKEVKSGQGADERDGDYMPTGGNPRVSSLGDWSETYFCDLVDWHLKSQLKMDWLTGSAQWVFKDFSTPVRPDSPVPYMNLKGVVERNNTPKEGYYVFQSYWTKKPMVRLYGHSWSVRWGKPGEKRLVRVYSNCAQAELFHNGASCGVRKRDPQNYPCAGLRWEVEFAPGVNQLRVIAEQNGTVESDSLEFVYQTEEWSAPVELRLTPSKSSDGRVYLEVRAYDANGVFCPDAACFVRFGVTGNGKLLDDLGTARGSRLVQLANGKAGIYAEHRDGVLIASVISDGLKTAYTVVKD